MEKRKRSLAIDILNGSMWDKILRYALPVAATGILGQLFNASDIAIVGNFAQGDTVAAVAAVGANGPVIGLLLNIFIGIALGANVVIANAIGRGDSNTVSRAVHTSIVAAVLGGIIVGLLGQLVAEPVLSMLQVPEDVFPLALKYMRIYLLGLPVIFLYNFEAAIFRSAGDTKTPLIALALSGVLNVILNLFFVIVLNKTVDGVAIATVLANVVSSVVLLRRLLRSELFIHVEFKNLRIDWKILWRILKIGVPAGIQGAVFSLSNIVVQSAINSLGKVTMAASSAAFNVEVMAYYILNSFGQACTTFVGQNYGAGQIDRCRKALKLCLIESVIATACAVCIALLSGKYLIALFNNDPEVIRLGMVRMKFIFMSYIFSTIYDCMSGYMRGFGISLTPALLTIFGVCGTRIIWIYMVFPMSQTFETIMQVYPISLAINMVLIFCALIITRPSKRYDHVVLDS
ncbi:MAG: MATE family efflux transporter [Oscillospiraceae bacterium]|nr:MATE family efflux transporter [Oscillospiraceae bacterium]